MSNELHYYENLLKRYLENSCNSEEFNELMDFLEKDASNRIILEQLQEQYDYSSYESNENTPITPEQSDRIRKVLMQKISSSSVIPLYRRSWLYMAAAVASIILISIGSYLNMPKKFSGKDGIVKTSNNWNRYKNDVLPGGNKAILKLADGSMVVLDDAKNGVLTQQGATKVIKLDGKLSYNPGHKTAHEIVYNTISTPRGGQYEIGLPDGSHVWLNASSTLRFPTAFAGKERRVEITGEAYFEIAKSKTMPFIVSVNSSEIRVMGTHFNVMAYSEEAAIKTTLLEGSVKFINGKDSSFLKPGQQSQLFKGRPIQVVNNADIEEVIAWKNGMFNFWSADLETVLKQLSRWYDVDIEYRNKTFKGLFVGEMPRSSKLSDVLKALELTGNLHFGIEGKKIIVE